jgi:NAD-dependent SIR2 family protein deacetylase
MQGHNVHGLLGDPQWPNPIRTAHCEEKSRPEYTSVDAHEYREVPEVLEEKVMLLASLIKKSQKCVAYTGAGLSVASGLDDYATKATETLNSRPHVSAERGSGYLATPNNGHKVLTLLYQQGLLKKVVNQNHDGLLQKAGFPQHDVNEIHGSWFDPANPGGNDLRSDFFAELLELEKTTDLCLALGTSLSGLNADRLAKTPASKYPKKGFGLVIVALQETQLDDVCTLRIFAPLDEVMTLLAGALELPDFVEPPLVPASNDIFVLPYDPQTGKVSSRKTCTLDLNDGARIKVLRGNYEGCRGVVGPKNTQGHYNLQIFSPVEGLPGVEITNDHLLGSWWIEEAKQGLITYLPVVPDLQ